MSTTKKTILLGAFCFILGVVILSCPNKGDILHNTQYFLELEHGDLLLKSVRVSVCLCLFISLFLLCVTGLLLNFPADSLPLRCHLAVKIFISECSSSRFLDLPWYCFIVVFIWLLFIIIIVCFSWLQCLFPKNHVTLTSASFSSIYKVGTQEQCSVRHVLARMRSSARSLLHPPQKTTTKNKNNKKNKKKSLTVLSACLCNSQ